MLNSKQIPHERKAHLLYAGLFFICLITLFFSQLLFSDHLLNADGLVPAYFENGLWSRFLFSGYPLFADPIWQTFYPLRFIIYKGLHLDFNFFVLSSYMLAGWFTYGYVYTLTRSKLSSYLSGFIFCFSGFSIFELGHAAVFMHTVAWLPLILWAFEKLKNQFSFFWMITASFGIAMSVLGGFPQLSVSMLPVIVSYSIFVALRTHHKFRHLLSFAIIISAGYLLTSIQIIPTIIQGLLSTRHEISWDMFSSFYVELSQLLLFVFPYLMGGMYSVYAHVGVYGDWQIVGNHGYVGFLSFILAAIAFYKTPRPLKGTVIYWLIAAIIALLVSLGPETGSFNEFLFRIPVFNNFRAPERYVYLFTFGIAVMAGIGIQSFLTGLIRTRFQKCLIYIVVLGFTFYIFGCLIHLYPSLQALAIKRETHLPNLLVNPAVLVPAGFILLSLGFLFYWLRKPTSLSRCMLTIALLSIELLSTAYFSSFHDWTVWNKSQLNKTPAALSELGVQMNKAHQRYWQVVLSSANSSKYVAFNFSLYNHLPSAAGYTSLANQRYLDFLWVDQIGSYNGEPKSLGDNQAINLLGIQYLFSNNQAASLNATLFKDEKHFVREKDIDDIVVYKNLQALPRAWFAHEVMTLTIQNLLPIIHTGKYADNTLFDPRKTALVEEPQTFHFDEDKTAGLTIKKLTDRRVVIYTQTQKPQFLVLGNLFYPGWKAYVDGKRTKLFETDYMLSGIAVDSGKHVVEFKFRPIYFYLAILISSCAAIGLIIFGIYAVRTFK